MGYAKGINWDDDKIEEQLREIIKQNKSENFPSQHEIQILTGNTKLTNAIRRHGGYERWSAKFGMQRKECESSFGLEYEKLCADFLINEFGYDCELMRTKYPYDLTVNKHIKVDVKVCRLFVSLNNTSYYTFNLEKSNPTCDIYVCYCTNDNKIEKIYVIPSKELYGKNQLSIGKIVSRYDKYLDAWYIFNKYNDFYESI